MKPFKNIPGRARRRNLRGYTLVEMMITIGVFLFIFTGVMVAVQLFGLRIYTLAATKMVATAGGRNALNQIRDQIRGGKTVFVGTCSAPVYTSFSLISTTNQQAGNALKICPTTDTNWYTIFYLDTSGPTNNLTNSLVQFDVSNNATLYSKTLTRFVTNQIIFDAEDFQGNIVSNYQVLDNRLLIRVTMQFSQLEYPIGFIGGARRDAYDSYQLRTRVFRRAWN